MPIGYFPRHDKWESLPRLLFGARCARWRQVFLLADRNPFSHSP
jgi:hypothetical protein